MNYFVNFSCAVLFGACFITNVDSRRPRSGADAFGGGVGAPGGSERDYDIRRPISPGGTDHSPDGGVIGEQEEKEIISPQQRPDLPNFETGVQEVAIGRSKICGTDGSLASQPMIDVSSSPKDSCPATPITSIWYNPSKSIGLATVIGLYTMQENGDIGVSSYGLSSHLQAGGLCGTKIDAAFTSVLNLGAGTKEYTVYFSGKHYSIYKDSFTYITGPHNIHEKHEAGIPTPLQLTFPWYVEKMDAAMKWQKNGGIYFFFKYFNIGYYSKYNPNTNTMYREYPRRTADWWRGLPAEGPDAAYSSPITGETYFIVGSELYMLPKGSTTVKSGYPMPIKDNFFRCV